MKETIVFNELYLKKYPYIFWINVGIRKNWFKYFWSTRGSNYNEYQIGIFKISIGCSWNIESLKSHIRDYSNLNIVKSTNDVNLKQKLSFQVRKYKK